MATAAENRQSGIEALRQASDYERRSIEAIEACEWLDGDDCQFALQRLHARARYFGQQARIHRECARRSFILSGMSEEDALDAVR